MSQQPPFLLLGRVLRPHGVRGELRVAVLTDYPERIVPDMQLFLGSDPASTRTARVYRVTGVRPHQQYLIIQLDGITDREGADLLREHYVMVALEDAAPLDEGEFYLYQLIGLDVVTDEGEHLGKVSEIIETGANDVYVVHGPRGEILLPSIDECVLEIDLEAGRITVHLMEGLLGD